MSEFEREILLIVIDAIIAGRQDNRSAHKVADNIVPAFHQRIATVRRARRSVKWDQQAIVEWQNATFGQPKSNFGIAARANVEMAELLRHLARDDESPEARDEIADVVITLCRLSQRLGGTIVADVDAKMEVNVRRKWELRGDGHGQHVRESGSNANIVPIAETCPVCAGTGVSSAPFEPTTMAKCSHCQK